MMERVALSAGRCGSECVEYSNENDYQAFVASIDLLSLHCPVCSAVGLFILYGYYKRFVIIDDISNGDCKI